MKKLKENTREFVIFLAGIAIPIIINYIGNLGNYLVIVLSALSFFFLLSIIVYQQIQMNKYVRYAILIFLLDKDCKLLLVKSQRFGGLIVPSGMVEKNEIPHKAVLRILKEEVGLKKDDFTFVTKKDEPFKNMSGRVLDCPPPFAVHQEFITKHKNHIKYHYAFCYLCSIKDNVKIDIDTKYFPQFYLLDEIENMDIEVKPFSDLVERYKNLLYEEKYASKS